MRAARGGANGVRVGVELTGVDAATARTGALAAEKHGLECVWIGCGDDVYTMTTLAAVAADTRDIRLGAILDLRGSGLIVRLAELIGLVDQLSGGRLELMLAGAPGSDWATDAAALLGARYGWEVEDGRTIPITPLPVQPRIPVLLRGAASARLADDLDAGLLVERGSPAAGDLRVALRAAPDDDVAGLRADLLAVNAAELVLTASPEQIPRIGIVLATGIRSGSHEVGFLMDSATRWFHDLRR